MTPWTALLESLHSALIDELTERHPDPKPTLGMPVRLSRLAPPTSATSVLFACDVTFDTVQGLALLAIQTEVQKELKLDHAALWQSLLRRAGSEFMRRGIKPRLGDGRELVAPFTLPDGFQEPGRVVWIPFSIPAGDCHLGIGV